MYLSMSLKTPIFSNDDNSLPSLSYHSNVLDAMPDDFIPRFSDEYEDPSGQDGASSDAPRGPAMSWEPLKAGGTNFGTHRLREVSSNRVAFRPVLGALLFSGAFAVVGLVVLLFSLKGIIFGGAPEEGRYILLLFGLIFAVAGFVILRGFRTPLVFDRSQGLFWRGRAPESPGNDTHGDRWARLHAVVGIQLLAEQVSGSEDNYHSYELNLVLEGGERVHVVDHGHAEHIRADADQLAYFLDVPVYDRR
jgi:hypothetical protein